MCKVGLQVSDRKELAKFLAERNINVENMTVNIVPPEYQEAVEEIIEVSVAPDESLPANVEGDESEEEPA